MTQLKVLFSGQSEEVKQNLVRCFDSKGIKAYFCTRNGNEVVQQIAQLQPQVVILDVFLSGIDAIGVKKECEKQSFVPQLFMAMSSCDSEHIEKSLISAGFVHCFLKPVSGEHILQVIDRFAHQDVKENTAPDLEYQVSEILHTMGVPAHIKGYGLLRQGIIMVIEDPEVITLVTKRLYPELAKQNGTTASRVERAIRHAIETAWDRGNVEVMNDYFGYTINNMRGKPTNSEFIAMISDRMRLAMKKKKTK